MFSSHRPFFLPRPGERKRSVPDHPFSEHGKRWTVNDALQQDCNFVLSNCGTQSTGNFGAVPGFRRLRLLFSCPFPCPVAHVITHSIHLHCTSPCLLLCSPGSGLPGTTNWAELTFRLCKWQCHTLTPASLHDVYYFQEESPLQSTKEGGRWGAKRPCKTRKQKAEDDSTGIPWESSNKAVFSSPFSVWGETRSWILEMQNMDRLKLSWTREFQGGDWWTDIAFLRDNSIKVMASWGLLLLCSCSVRRPWSRPWPWPEGKSHRRSIIELDWNGKMGYKLIWNRGAMRESILFSFYQEKCRKYYRNVANFFF